MSAITWDREPVLSLPVRARGSLPVGARGAATVGARSLGAPTEAPTHLRLTGRGRIVVWALAVAVAAGVSLSAQSAGADGPGSAMPVETYVVAPGETLWQIAGSITAPGQDRRDVVDELVELNGLGGAGLRAGEEILVPVR